MDETPQDHSQEYVITHSKDGWIFQFVEYLQDENSSIYKCPSCNMLIRVTPVELDTSNVEQGQPAETPPGIPEKQESQLDTRSDQEIEQQQPTRRKRNKSRVERPSHAV